MTLGWCWKCSQVLLIPVKDPSTSLTSTLCLCLAVLSKKLKVEWNPFPHDSSPLSADRGEQIVGRSRKADWAADQHVAGLVEQVSTQRCFCAAGGERGLTVAKMGNGSIEMTAKCNHWLFKAGGGQKIHTQKYMLLDIIGSRRSSNFSSGVSLW